MSYALILINEQPSIWSRRPELAGTIIEAVETWRHIVTSRADCVRLGNGLTPEDCGDINPCLICMLFACVIVAVVSYLGML